MSNRQPTVCDDCEHLYEPHPGTQWCKAPENQRPVRYRVGLESRCRTEPRCETVNDGNCRYYKVRNDA